MTQVRRSVGVVVAAAAIAIASPRGADAQPVQMFHNVGWRDITPAVCLARAEDAINQAVTAFAMIDPEIRGTFYFRLGQTAGLVLIIFCIGDDGTPAIAGEGAPRVLNLIEVGTNRDRFGGAVRDFLMECMAGACPVGVAPPPVPIGWRDNAESLAQRVGERFVFTCPALEAGRPFAMIWGTDVYTTDSPICTAAVHAGVITSAGGPVTIEILPPQPGFPGSVRNGISSNTWRAYSGYRVILPGG